MFFTPGYMFCNLEDRAGFPGLKKNISIVAKTAAHCILGLSSEMASRQMTSIGKREKSGPCFIFTSNFVICNNI